MCGGGEASRWVRIAAAAAEESREKERAKKDTRTCKCVCHFLWEEREIQAREGGRGWVSGYKSCGGGKQRTSRTTKDKTERKNTHTHANTEREREGVEYTDRRINKRRSNGTRKHTHTHK